MCRVRVGKGGGCNCDGIARVGDGGESAMTEAALVDVPVVAAAKAVLVEVKATTGMEMTVARMAA